VVVVVVVVVMPLSRGARILGHASRRGQLCMQVV